ncbi:Sec1-like protein [Blyttiomyces helicus]|uniref:Sec1-like protein n=1 Tax=Blyttiomyces helicus TaxID=388810 RepID=A0A4P9WRB5_9FUNG|nr:Sec1-like protein [Blyttiomyces helicus]|eukprot:RKO93436.1 Sec1-like protein [Blyttiomyces helicus]
MHYRTTINPPLSSSDFSSNAKGLSVAIKQLPELTERKRVLDMHMNIATSLFELIRERQLDQFFAMEENITKQTKALILEALRDPKKSPEDKLRLFLIFYLSVDEVSKDDLADYEKAMVESGCTVAALQYVKQVRAFSRMTAMSNVAPPAQSSANDFLGRFTSIGSKLTDSLKDAGVSGHFETLLSGVKNLLPTRKDLPATRIVDALIEGTAGGETDDYLYLDPKLGRSAAAKGAKPGAARGGPVQDAIVFVVGGGNYLEYQNLVDFASRKRIVYGSTELLTAKAFLGQLEALGEAR